MGRSKVVIAGGSGLLGQALQARLTADEREVVLLCRKPAREGTWTFHTPYSEFRETTLAWDGQTVGDWWRALDGAEAVVNLAGRSIDCRFTPENRRQILNSRVDSVRAIGEAIGRCTEPPKVWLQSSAMAIYGDTGDRACDERDAPSSASLRAPTPSASSGQVSPAKGEVEMGVSEFMQHVCLLWEHALRDAGAPSTRKVAFRSAVVLDPKLGAFPKIRKLVKWGLGGHAGSGRQFFSWIHVDDWVEAAVFLLERPDLEGAFNLSSPNPVSNREFMAAIRRAARRPWSPPVPAPLLRLGSHLMGTEGDLVLGSQRVLPARLLEAGFRFSSPDVDPAVADLAEKA